MFKNAKIEKWGIFGWFSNIVFCFSCKALVSLPNKNMVHILQNIQILEYTLCTTVFHLRCEVLFSIKRPFFAAIFLWKCNSFANKNLLICFALEQLVQLWKKKNFSPLISSKKQYHFNVVFIFVSTWIPKSFCLECPKKPKYPLSFLTILEDLTISPLFLALRKR